MLRGLVSIVLIICFGVYSGTFKTHYSFYHTGGLFHGDCHAARAKAAEKGETGLANLFADPYACIDIIMPAGFIKSKRKNESRSRFLFFTAGAIIPFVSANKIFGGTQLKIAYCRLERASVPPRAPPLA